MSIDHSRAVIQHHCDPPEIKAITFPERLPGAVAPPAPVVTVYHPEGTRFTCDECGAVQEVWRRPSTASRGGYAAGGLEWRPVPWWRRLSWGGRFQS